MRNGFWIIAFVLLFLAMFIPSFSHMQDLRKKNQEYEAKIKFLQVKQEELKKEIDLLQNDPTYLEKVAREKMGLKRQGEVVIDIQE